MQGCRTTPTSDNWMTICTSTSRTSTRCRRSNASTRPGAPKQPPSPPTAASPTPRADTSTPLPATAFWPTPVAFLASTGPATAEFRQRRWPWTPMGECSAISGRRARGAWQTSNRRNRSARKPRGGLCAGSEPAAFPPSAYPSFSPLRSPAHSSAISSRRPQETQSGDRHRFSPDSSGRRLPRPESRSSTTTP